MAVSHLVYPAYGVVVQRRTLTPSRAKGKGEPKDLLSLYEQNQIFRFAQDDDFLGLRYANWETALVGATDGMRHRC